jgi:hypothetical protein
MKVWVILPAQLVSQHDEYTLLRLERDYSKLGIAAGTRLFDQALTVERVQYDLMTRPMRLRNGDYMFREPCWMFRCSLADAVGLQLSGVRCLVEDACE